MKLSTYLYKKIVDLLDTRRIVVWYDSEGDFRAFAAEFKAPNTEVLSAEQSILKTRRRADEIYRLMNESDDPAESGRCMLIYIPRRRGVTDEEKMRDPFEVYALAGAAFGDTEDQRQESLARQAMPDRAEEITRLFREGRPTIQLLDGLEKTQRYPLLHEVLRTESPTEVTALVLCDKAKAKAVDETPGCTAELLRLLETSVRFKPSGRAKTWKSLRSGFAEFVLFSEFIFDLSGDPPESLSAVERAGSEAKETILAACERMRSDTNLRNVYTELASKVEEDLHLPEMFGDDFDPGERDTFPFEERQLLRRLVDRAVSGDFAAARSILKGRTRSIWRHDPDRSLAWTAAERGVFLLETVERISAEIEKPKSLTALVEAYVSGGWAELDRNQRLFESGLTACIDESGLSPLIDQCRCKYRELALRIQDRFLELVQAEGWPPEGTPRQTSVFDEHVAPALDRREKVAYFPVDSLRFEMGCDLSEALKRFGETEIGYAAAVVPTITSCGMAALMPKADGMLRLLDRDGGLVTALGTRLLKTSSDRMNLLKESYGDRFLDTTLDELLTGSKKLMKKMQNIDLLTVRTQDPDVIGESLGGWRARRYLSDVIGDITSAVKLVINAGFKRIVISSDHGHVLLPEIPAGDVVPGPSGRWIETKRRCRLGSGISGRAGTLTLKAGHVGVQGDVEDVCIPLGFKVFSDGEAYFHGGLSLQEAIVPVVVLQAGREGEVVAGKPEIDIRYRSDRFTSRVIGLKFFMQSDIFGTLANVRIEAYDGTTSKAKVVGEAADCEARDEKTREVTLQPNVETPVPILLDPDFEGPEVEIRVSDLRTRVVWTRRRLKNAMLE